MPRQYEIVRPRAVGDQGAEPSRSGDLGRPEYAARRRDDVGRTDAPPSAVQPGVVAAVEALAAQLQATHRTLDAFVDRLSSGPGDEPGGTGSSGASSGSRRT